MERNTHFTPGAELLSIRPICPFARTTRSPSMATASVSPETSSAGPSGASGASARDSCSQQATRPLLRTTHPSSP